MNSPGSLRRLALQDVPPTPIDLPILPYPPAPVRVRRRNGLSHRCHPRSSKLYGGDLGPAHTRRLLMDRPPNAPYPYRTCILTSPGSTLPPHTLPYPSHCPHHDARARTTLFPHPSPRGKFLTVSNGVLTRRPARTQYGILSGRVSIRPANCSLHCSAKFSCMASPQDGKNPRRH